VLERPPSFADRSSRHDAGEAMFCAPRSAPGAGGRAFSLIELVIALAVAIILTSLLLPCLSQVREHAHRLMCSANLRQLGLAFAMYDREYDALPFSCELDKSRYGELMVARVEDHDEPWDGLGLLYRLDYCRAPECFYCPSHTGTHSADRYDWRLYESERIYTNYHYSGHVSWMDPTRRRSLNEGLKLVLATDALSQADWNHGDGMNMLRGDGSVRWFADTSADGFVNRLPVAAGAPPPPEFRSIWGELESQPPK
jgi:competence protein ComGC